MAPSTGDIVADYYGRDKFSKYADVIDACNRVDSANLTFDEILNPQGWVLLAFLMDSRTGMGYYRDYKISNYDLMMKMVDMIREKSMEDIFNDSDVKERIDRYKEDSIKFHVMMRDESKMHGDCVVTDLRNVETQATGNRFLIYSIFPDCNISIRAFYGRNKENVVFALGHSILNRTSKVNVGELMAKYGGGGHIGAGTCQIDLDKADQVLSEILKAING